MAELFTCKFRKMPVRLVRLDNGKNYFVIRDIYNILGFSNPNRILAQYTENVPLYERIRTPGGLQVAHLVPREDVERIIAPNNGRKALLLERWLVKNIFPALEADEVALAQVRSLVVGFVSAMHTIMTEQYFADKYGSCNGRCNEITKALHLWFSPGDVFEVRVLDAVTGGYRREHVESGYFDYEHISAVPDALNALMSYRGVYVTVNPVNPDLLARARFRIAVTTAVMCI